ADFPETTQQFSAFTPQASEQTADFPETTQQFSAFTPEASKQKVKIDLDTPVPQGFATGGEVTTTYVHNNQQVAPSDTVAAMLTPGEFVINARDAQKNLNILKHINSGGTANDTIFTHSKTSNSKDPKETTSVESSTKVDSLQDTSLQPKNSDNISSQVSHSLISSSLGLDIGKQRRSILTSPELNTNVSKTTNVGTPSFHYSSPSLIFRQKNPSPSTNTPSQWSSLEELLNESADVTDFNFSGVESHRQSEFSQVTSHGSKVPSESPKVFTKNLVQPKGFADGGEVTKADINTKKQPITEMIEKPSSAKNEDDDANLEVLAREIYSRLRQRLEIERERSGVYSGRLPW
ncbi:hypothetical protein, partial [Brasilonema sp. UFV-L1]|uniref:hypothetical protein n=1 Tax=Brasilonema sp. UFV-L1 TaxID=2234130 RepID=UPI00145C3E5D